MLDGASGCRPTPVSSGWSGGYPLSDPRIRSVDGDRPASDTHSFIVKVWLEETVEEAGRATWRGYITHVPDDDRRYLRDLASIPFAIAPYLEQMGVRLSLLWRVKRWLRKRPKPRCTEG